MEVADQLTLGLGGSHSCNAQTNFWGFILRLNWNITSFFGDLRFNASKQKTNKQIILGDTGADRRDDGKVETREKLSDIFSWGSRYCEKKK